MRDADDADHVAAATAAEPAIQCAACRAALEAPGRDTTSFLLLEQLAIPLVGCATHKREFSDVCELTTDRAAELLDHRPAGGLRCPGCRHSTRRSQQPVVPVGTGGVAVVSCSRHLDDIVGRFRTGLRTRHRLTTSLPSE
jgi:hypothetical protein